MAKIESERGAQAFLFGLLVGLLDQANVLSMRSVAQHVRELAEKDGSGEGREYLLAVAAGIEGQKPLQLSMSRH
jgi:hypothetical protein